MSWQEKYFGGEDYLLLEAAGRARTVERCVEFIGEALRLGPGSRVLDAGCGPGRYALALARRGCLVTAVDASPYMVELTRQLADGEPRLTVRQLDFRELAFAGEFDAVLCWGHSLGYGSPADDAAAIARLAAALAPGGRLLLDLHNLPWYRRHGVGRTWVERESAFVLSQAVYDPLGRRLLCWDTVVPKAGGPARRYAAAYREYEPAEVTALLESSGIEGVEFYGDARATDDGLPFSREGFTAESQAMVVAGTRAAADIGLEKER